MCSLLRKGETEWERGGRGVCLACENVIYCHTLPNDLSWWGENVRVTFSENPVECKLSSETKPRFFLEFQQVDSPNLTILFIYERIKFSVGVRSPSSPINLRATLDLQSWPMTSKLNHERDLWSSLFFVIRFLVFSAGMARDILSKKPVPAKPWKKLISAGKKVCPT